MAIYDPNIIHLPMQHKRLDFNLKRKKDISITMKLLKTHKNQIKNVKRKKKNNHQT